MVSVPERSLQIAVVALKRRRTVVLIGVAILISVVTVVALVTGLSRHRSPTPLTVATEQQLLLGRVGFGRGVTGGLAGPVVHVTTSADSGPGSLRAAVAGNTPAWVVFDDDYTIRLDSGVAVGSNKTIDGRGHKVTLTGHGTDGLVLKGVSNIIVANMLLHDFGDVAKTSRNDKPDAIHIERSSNVWVDHCDLSEAGDKLVAVANGSTDVTVSWNHFHDQQQVFQIGDQASAAAAAEQNVTVDHNYFDHTGYRNPVVSYGKAHVFNNYYVGWRLYGVRSERVAQVYLENNVFAAGSSRRASDVSTGGSGCNDEGTRCDPRRGYLEATGNLLENGAELQTNAVADMFKPSDYYRYQAEPATSALAAEIVKGAGWQAYFLPLSQPTPSG